MSFSTATALDFSTPDKKAEAYRDLIRQTQALFEGERDWVANMAQFAALVYTQVPDLNWAGFYLVRGRDELVLGPFQGKVACVRIPFSRGVCGACARSAQVQLVPDVHAFDGHIACDSASASELVLPILLQGRLVGIFDLDSPSLGRFDELDAQGLQMALQCLVAATDWGH